MQETAGWWSTIALKVAINPCSSKKGRRRRVWQTQLFYQSRSIHAGDCGMMEHLNNITDFLHSHNFTFGLYTSESSVVCSGRPGSLYEVRRARQCPDARNTHEHPYYFHRTLMHSHLLLGVWISLKSTIARSMLLVTRATKQWPTLSIEQGGQ